MFSNKCLFSDYKCIIGHVNNTEYMVDFISHIEGASSKTKQVQKRIYETNASLIIKLKKRILE